MQDWRSLGKDRENVFDLERSLVILNFGSRRDEDQTQYSDPK
jgi:hypothetical protein